MKPRFVIVGMVMVVGGLCVAVVAPAPLEMRVLRPILMGHHPAMDVDFSEGIRPDNTVLINVYFAD